MKLEQVAHSAGPHLQGAEVVMDSECCPMLPTLMRHVFMEINVLNNMQVHAQQVGYVVLFRKSTIPLIGRLYHCSKGLWLIDPC